MNFKRAPKKKKAKPNFFSIFDMPGVLGRKIQSLMEGGHI